MRSALVLSALAGLAAAHFELKYPESIGFEDDNEDKAPCGGFTPDLSKDLVDWHVGGEAIALRLTHPQSNWLFRVTTDPKAESGWEQFFPIVQQSGLGDFCEPAVTLPESFIGKKGVVSIVSSAVDGLLYQCVVANFVEGSADAPSECKNASSVKISYTSDSKLSALVGDSTNDTDSTSTPESATGSATGSVTGSATSAAASSTNTGNAAASLQAWSVSGLGNVVAILSMAVVGGVFMI